MGICVGICLSAVWTPYNSMQSIFIFFCIGLGVGLYIYTISGVFTLDKTSLPPRPKSKWLVWNCTEVSTVRATL